MPIRMAIPIPLKPLARPTSWRLFVSWLDPAACRLVCRLNYYRGTPRISDLRGFSFLSSPMTVSQETDSSNEGDLPEWGERRAAVRLTRIQSIFAAWRLLTDGCGDLDSRMQQSTIVEVVEHYLNDVEALINRHRIRARIQHHKIAGLIAANFLKLKPIVPVSDVPLKRVFRDNEVFALRHALSVCFQVHKEGLAAFHATPGFNDWFSNMVEFMHRRPDCGECLIAIFDTLSAVYIPAPLRSAAGD